jgi:hypothetical protein
LYLQTALAAWLRERGITDSLLSPSVEPEKVFAALAKKEPLLQEPHALSPEAVEGVLLCACVRAKGERQIGARGEGFWDVGQCIVGVNPLVRTCGAHVRERMCDEKNVREKQMCDG